MGQLAGRRLMYNKDQTPIFTRTSHSLGSQYAKAGSLLLGARSLTSDLNHEMTHILLDFATKKTAIGSFLREFGRDPFLLLTKGTGSYSDSLREGVQRLINKRTVPSCGNPDFIGPCKH